MSAPKVFFVVGHEHWGKSHTLRELTAESVRRTQVQVGGVTLFVRRMSNDDAPASFIRFMQHLMPQLRPFVIATLCPNFERSGRRTVPALEQLRTVGYRLYFWVLHHAYADGRVVEETEIDRLGEYGEVSVFEPRVEAAERAAAFRRFVTTHLQSP